MILGILVFVIGGMLMANAWAAIDARMAVASAAQAASRTYVEAPDASEAGRRAELAAREAIAAHGRNAERLHLSVETGDRGFSRCERVQIRATYELDRVSLPVLGGMGGDYEVSAVHAELIDPFRSGVPGDADCG